MEKAGTNKVSLVKEESSNEGKGGGRWERM